MGEMAEAQLQEYGPDAEQDSYWPGEDDSDLMGSEPAPGKPVPAVQPSLPPLKSKHAKDLPAGAINVIRRIAMERKMILALTEEVMVEGVHYGNVPGTDKPTLFQPGAQVLAQVFKLAAVATVTRETLVPNQHYLFSAKVRIQEIATGDVRSEWFGLCSSMEPQYRWRKPTTQCPTCGHELFRKKEWFCWRKKGGCGATFSLDDPKIKTPTGKVENPDIADIWPTCAKMAEKRAFVSAVIVATGSSDLYTVDIGDSSPRPGQSSASSPSAQDSEERQKLLARLEGALDKAGADDVGQSPTAQECQLHDQRGTADLR